MRTTLSIDDDIAALIDEEVRRSGDSYKGTVNRLLKKGLIATREPARREPFVVTPLPMTLPDGLSYDKIEALLEALDGPGHK